MDVLLCLKGWPLRYIKQHGRGPLLCIGLTVETVGRKTNFPQSLHLSGRAQLGPLKLEHLLAVQLRSNKKKMRKCSDKSAQIEVSTISARW